jgi:hypothetical protein
MAIIKCPECGQSVSELAANCPGCGCPINGNIDHCPECGAVVLKTYEECPVCHCPIKKMEEQKIEGSHLFQLASDAFNAGKVHQASVYAKQAAAAGCNDPVLADLQSRITAKLNAQEQKFTEVKHLFEEVHQPYSALALLDKLIAADPADEYLDYKDKVVLSVTKDLMAKARTSMDSGKPESALPLLNKALSYDKSNNEIKAMIEEAEMKVEKKKKRKKNLIISFIVAAVVIIGVVIGVYVHNIQAENSAWDNLQSSTNINDYEQFLSKYPNGRHHDEALALYNKLNAELTDWATVANTTDKYAVQTFLQKYPNGFCATQAKNKLDSLSWVDACNLNKPEAYAQYIQDFPNGRFVNLAQQKTSQLKAQEVTPAETSQIGGVLSQFFDAVASQDEANLLGAVESTMSSFLNKKNATKAHVLAFMKQMHAADMTSIAFTVNKDLKINKTQNSDGSNSYTVTCTVDEKIERTDTSKESFVNYGVSCTIDNFMKISSFGLRKVSSY